MKKLVKTLKINKAAKISCLNKVKGKKMQQHHAFLGMHHANQLSVDEYMKKLRAGRYEDIENVTC